MWIYNEDNKKKNIARWWEKEKWQKKKTYIGQTTYEWRCGSKA